MKLKTFKKVDKRFLFIFEHVHGLLFVFACVISLWRSAGGLWLQVPPPDWLTGCWLISISQPTVTGRAARRRTVSSCLSTRVNCFFFPAGRMSVAVVEGCFLSALQPNSSCTTYVVPSDGPCPDPVAKARRVREQVRMRLAEKKSSSLPGLEDSLLGSTGGSHILGGAVEHRRLYYNFKHFLVFLIKLQLVFIIRILSAVCRDVTQKLHGRFQPNLSEECFMTPKRNCSNLVQIRST